MREVEEIREIKATCLKSRERLEKQRQEMDERWERRKERKSI